MKKTSNTSMPKLPASSRMQMPSSSSESMPLIKGLIKGNTKTKMK